MKIYEISKSPLFEISKAEKKRQKSTANQQKFDAAQPERDAENKLKSDKLAQITQMRADAQAQAIANQQKEEEKRKADWEEALRAQQEAEEKRKAELRAEREAEEKRKEEYEATVGKEKYMQINFSPKEYKEYSEPLEYLDSYDTSLVQEALQYFYNKHGKIKYVGYYPASSISLVIGGKLQIRNRRTNKVEHEIGIWSNEIKKPLNPVLYPKTIKEAVKLIGLLCLNDVNKLINHKIFNEDDIHYQEEAHGWKFFPLDGDRRFAKNIEFFVQEYYSAFGKSNMIYDGQFRKDAMWEIFSRLFPDSSFYLTQTERIWGYGTLHSATRRWNSYTPTDWEYRTSDPVNIKFQDGNEFWLPKDFLLYGLLPSDIVDRLSRPQIAEKVVGKRIN